MALAPADRRDHPRVVLLTPGPLNETYFEHAYLARYLGFTLVEGADLTVRDSRVFIKTLEGLRQVDVILRRLDDSFCDPLELRSDSTLGVAGLVDAVRAGHVTMANALGSGLVEAPGMAAFLPTCAATCSAKSCCSRRRDRGGAVIPTTCTMSWPTSTSWSSSSRSRPRHDSRCSAARSTPSRRVCCEARCWRARRSTPRSRKSRSRPRRCGTVHGSEARQLVLRVYVASNGDSMAVMPGGLTRVGAASNIPIVTMQRGGGSKDTWIVSDGPVTAVSLLAPMRLSVRRERLDADLPSRVADNLFWMGRHIERAEQIVRLLRSLVDLCHPRRHVRGCAGAGRPCCTCWPTWN